MKTYTRVIVMYNNEAIPKVIHYCWFGKAPISDLGEYCIKTWCDVMPDYEIRVWDDSCLDRSIPYVDIAYRAGRPAFVADYTRLRALLDFGGLYFDTDMEILKPFDALLDLSLFFGLQDPGNIGAGAIGAVKGHPFLRLALDRLDAEGRSGKLTFRPLPVLITELAAANPSIAPTLLPEECCYPYNPYSRAPLRRKPLFANMTERTLCIHHWEGTWLGHVTFREMLRQRVEHALRRVTPWRRGRLLSAASHHP